MYIHSKPCVIDEWDIYRPKSRGTLGSGYPKPKPVPKDKDDFIKEDEFKI